MAQVDTIIAQACASGIGKIENPVTLLRIIAQLLSESSTPSTGGQYFMQIISPGANAPADSTTYFLGGDVSAAATSWVQLTTFSAGSFIVPATCTITRCFIKVKVRTTLGTNEAVQHIIRVNDTTDYNVGNLTYDASQTEVNNTALSIPVNAGDTIALKIVTPAWVTNPVGVSLYGYFFATIP